MCIVYLRGLNPRNLRNLRLSPGSLVNVAFLELSLNVADEIVFRASPVRGDQQSKRRLAKHPLDDNPRIERLLRDLVDHPDFLFVDAIRARADGQADDLRMIDGVQVKLPQVLGIGVRIRERLEINDELVRFETFPNVLNSVADLVADG